MLLRARRTVGLAVVTVVTSLVASLMGAVLLGPPADAAYPGRDGRIAFVRGNHIYTMTPSGTGITRLTGSGKNYRPTWSPDGRRISFIHEEKGRTDVWVMSANGRNKQAVTRTGDVSSAGASWSPDGRTLAFATPELQVIRSTAPFGVPTTFESYPTGGFCGDEPDVREPVYVDRFVTWAPGGTRIAVLDHSDCYYDDRIDMYYPATKERRQYAAMGGDCCGYVDWTDLFWGPDGTFGYTERDLGPYGDDVDAPSRIVYPGFASRDGDTGGAPSPSGTYLALSNATSGTAYVIRARADGSGRRVLAAGHQPSWQPLP